MKNEFLRHLIATIAYRLAKAVNNATPEFYYFEAGSGIRKPKEILHHMCQVIAFAIAVLDKQPRRIIEQMPGGEQLNKFYELLESTDDKLAVIDLENENRLKLVQGPFADIFTHIGQLALLRRYVNDPVPAENFMNANVKIGVIKIEDQNLNSSV